MRVVLPAPFGPSNPIARPRRSPRRSLRIGRPPKVTLKPSRSMTGLSSTGSGAFVTTSAGGSDSTVLGTTFSISVFAKSIKKFTNRLSDQSLEGFDVHNTSFSLPQTFTRPEGQARACTLNLKRLRQPLSLSSQWLAFISHKLAQLSMNRMLDDVAQSKRPRHADQARRLQPDRTFFAVDRETDLIAL